jgi:hypothetical protein
MENKWMIGRTDFRKKIKKEKIKFLTQGAYGCIFHPGFTCKKSKVQSKKFITKIETKNNTAEKEFAIGEYIRKKIKNYNTMFAPIISYCPIEVSKINKDAIKQCTLIKDEKIIYSNKIRYVGKQSLEPYLYSCLEENLNNTSFFISQLFETHIYLTNSIEKLIHNKIVHFDIKENNVMYDNNKYLPIIIDFGLSFRIDLLKSNVEYEKAFYLFSATCIWWCLEIAMISFIVCKEYKTTSESANWMTDIIDVKYLLSILEYYYTENPSMKLISIQWGKEVEISKQKWHKYISTQFKNKTGKFIVETLMQSWDRWDLFALSFMYLSFLQNLCVDCLDHYQSFLVEYILAFHLEDKTSIKKYYNKLVSFSEEYADIKTLTFDSDKYKENTKKTNLQILELEKQIY